MYEGELQSLSLEQLLSLRRAIVREIAARGYSRTSSSLEGELMERAVADAYGGRLLPPGTKSADVLDSDGRRIQVKTRSLPPGQTRFWQFRDFDFDLTVVIWLDRLTGDVVFARELTRTEVESVVIAHPSGGWRLRMGRARSVGADVTNRIRQSYSELV